MTSLPMQQWVTRAVEDARARLRGEVWALELAPSSIGASVLLALADDSAGFKFSSTARRLGLRKGTFRSRWDRAGLPSVTPLRDAAKAHVFASLLQADRVSLELAIVSAGETTRSNFHRLLRRSGLTADGLRRPDAVRGTLEGWSALLRTHRDQFIGLEAPRTMERPTVAARVLQAEITETERRLADLRAQLRRCA